MSIGNPIMPSYRKSDRCYSMSVGDRIRERLGELGISGAELARRVGLKQPTISELMTGKSRSSAHLHLIARALKTTPEYLLEEIDDPAPDSPVNDARQSYGHEPAQKGDDMVAVHQIDLSFGLGSAIMDTEIFEDRAETLDFPRSWLRMITPNSPSQLCWARGKGNSMFPTIGDGDVILIDRGQRSLFDSDLIWAVSYGDAATIKRLRPMPDGGVKMMPDNSNVPPETAYDGELNIFGRVIAVVRRL